MKKTLLAFLFLTAATLSAQTALPDVGEVKSYSPMVSEGKFLGDIAPLRDLAPAPVPPPQEKLWHKSNYFFPNKLNNPDPLPRSGDPLAKKNTPAQPDGGPEIKPGLNFEGLYDGGVTPPDPTGDIGKNHYVQMINASSGGSWFQIWDKTGKSVLGPIRTNTIWQQVGSGSIGDPIIQYDHGAERWLMMEMQGGNELLLAVSNNSDPTGGWKAYRIPTLGFPDYPKFYVWNNAYFITVNEIIGSNVCSGFALDRSAILAGDPNFKVYRFQMPNYLAIQYQPATGADWEGGPPPPPGSPGYIFRVYDDSWDGGADQLQLWEVNVDWNDVSKSHIDGPTKFFPTPFETKVCFGGGLFDCIEQPNPNAPRMTALENIIMYRAPYRNFGAYESIVLNHVSDVSAQVGEGGDAQMRWYEMRRYPGGSWQIFQQGTYAPDLKTNRFTGTICTDDVGNIGIGYTVCSDVVNPGLRLSGRRAGDPNGTMPVQEYSLIEGTSSHFDQRWGDYSNLAVDPEDGRTFWFTGEYQPSGKNWGTRVGSFRIQRDTFDISPITLDAPLPTADLGDAQVSASVLNGGVFDTDGPISISLFFEGNLVVTDQLTIPVQPSASVTHTFSKTVSMTVPGKNYQFMIVTKWAKDLFVKNDTLRTTVKKLTSNDIAIAGRSTFPGYVCGVNSDVSILIRNASGLPMTSARIRHRINAQPFQDVQWTGNLAPDARDTVPISLFNISNGQNVFQCIVDMPNGTDDQDVSNDTITFKFFGNTTGTYLTLEAETYIGLLHWELRTNTGSILSSGDLPASKISVPVCSSDNTCYQFVLRSNTLKWQGQIRLLDFSGKTLLQANSASPTPTVIDFCTPARKQIDVGAWQLLTPQSGSVLSSTEPVKIAVRNFGLTNQNNLQVSYRINGGAWTNESLPGTLLPGETREHTFANTADLSAFGANYNFEIKATATGDQTPSNDSKTVLVQTQFFREVSLDKVTLLKGCDNVSDVQVALQMKNNGLNPVQNVAFHYTLNGGSVQTIQTNFNIQPKQQATLSPVLIAGSTDGTNNLRIWLSGVNNQGPDGVAANDTATFSYTLDVLSLPLGLSLTTDNKPSETTWTVTDSHNNIVASGGPFASSNLLYTQSLCLRKDSCFTLHVFDAGGDGMEGSISLFSGATTFWTYSGGNFGGELTYSFCNKGACTALTVSANVTPDKPTPNPDGLIVGSATGGKTPYKYALDNGAYKSTPVFAGLAAGTYVLKCKDANGCITEITVVVTKTSAVEDLNTPQRKLSASPNPTTGLVFLELPALNGEKEAVCEVFDSRGTLLQTVRMARWDDMLRGGVAMEPYAPGMYVLRLRGQSEVLSARVIKQ